MARKVTEVKDCMKTFEGDGIPVTRAFPVPGMRELDPFLLFDHFGPIHYEPGGATGVPAHPHCGFEAITYLLGGEVEHKDSWGGQASIETGDIQWMTTGSGLIHSELVTDKFKKSGGIMQGLQIWVNLPKQLKMMEPEYRGLQKDQISIWKNEEETVIAQVISGNFKGIRGAFDTPTSVSLSLVHFEKKSEVQIEIPKSDNIFFYVIRGKLEVNEIEVPELHLAEFSKNSEILNISAEEKSILLLGHAEPFQEKVVFGGPFVMNSEEEIQQAYADYKAGKMGNWEE